MGNAACRALGALRAEDFPGDLTPLVDDALMLSEQMQVTPLCGEAARTAVAVALGAYGFTFMRWHGPSIYLRRPGCPFKIRISDHGCRELLDDLLCSRVVTQIGGVEGAQKIAAELATAFSAALRDRHSG